MIVSFVGMLDRFKLMFFVFICTAFSGVAQIDTVRVFGEENLLKSLYKLAKKDSFLDCHIVIGSEKVPAKIRVRGDSSRKLAKKSLKVKFTHKGEEQVLNLNAEYKDRSYMHQHMAAYVYRKAGVPTFNTTYKVVLINNEFSGIYLQVENMDEAFLKRSKLPTGGNLYKAKKDGSNLSLYDNVHSRWQKNANKNGDKKGLQDLITSINEVPDSGFLRLVKRTFDYDNLITSIAVNSLIGNASTYYHNYFLYHDITNSGKWMMFPWDMDKTMGSYDTRLPYYYSSWSWKNGGGQPENPLVYRLLHNKKGFKDYKKKLEMLSKSIFNSDKLQPEIDALKKQLEPYIEADLKDAVKSKEAWLQAVRKMELFIKHRTYAIKKQFKEYPSLFSLNNAPGYQFDTKAKLSWEKSTSFNDSVVYHVRISPSKGFKKDVLEFRNITDTKLVVKGLKPGRYYWHVLADNGKHQVNGFNTRNHFDIGKAVVLGGKIKGKKVLKNTHVVIFKDLKIGAKSSLTFGEGVTVTVNPNIRIYNRGVLKIIGTKKRPVVLKNRKRNEAWLGIFSTGMLEINHAQFSGIKGESVIRQIEGQAKMQNTLSQYNKVRETASFNSCPAIVTNNVVKYSKGEGILFLKCSGLVKHNALFGIPDGIEATRCKDLTITENFMIDASDDGIDVNYGSNIHVTHNTAINCKDKGMSISGKEHDSTIFFEENYIQNCTRGIGVEGKGIVNLIGNIYYNNKKQLFLENRKGLTIYSKGEHFNSIKTIDKHVTVTDLKTFSLQYLEGLQVKMEYGKTGNTVDSVTLTNQHLFPISLKGLAIKSGKKVLYKFNEHVVLFPGKGITIESKQTPKSFDKLVLNKVKSKKKIKLIDTTKPKVKKKKNKGNWIYIFGSLVLVLGAGIWFVKKKRKDA